MRGGLRGERIAVKGTSSCPFACKELARFGAAVTWCAASLKLPLRPTFSPPTLTCSFFRS